MAPGFVRFLNRHRTLEGFVLGIGAERAIDLGGEALERGLGVDPIFAQLIALGLIVAGVVVSALAERRRATPEPESVAPLLVGGIAPRSVRLVVEDRDGSAADDDVDKGDGR